MREEERETRTHELKHLPPPNLVPVIHVYRDPHQFTDDELLRQFGVLVPLLRFEHDDELGPFRLGVERQCRDDGFEVCEKGIFGGAEVVEVGAGEEGGVGREILVEGVVWREASAAGSA